MPDKSATNSYRHLLGGAFKSGIIFVVLFMIHNRSWGNSLFDFSYLQFLGIASSIILGSGFAHYKHTNEPKMSYTFLKIIFVLLSASILIAGAKFIYFDKSITITVSAARFGGDVALVHDVIVPGLFVGFLYIVSAIWTIWQFVLNDNKTIWDRIF